MHGAPPAASPTNRMRPLQSMPQSKLCGGARRPTHLHTYLQHNLWFRVPLLPTTVGSSLCLCWRTPCCCAGSAALTAAVLLLRLPSHAVLAELPRALAIAGSTTQLQAGHITATAPSGYWLSLCNGQQPRGTDRSHRCRQIGLAQLLLTWLAAGVPLSRGACWSLAATEWVSPPLSLP